MVAGCFLFLQFLDAQPRSLAEILLLLVDVSSEQWQQYYFLLYSHEILVDVFVFCMSISGSKNTLLYFVDSILTLYYVDYVGCNNPCIHYKSNAMVSEKCDSVVTQVTNFRDLIASMASASVYDMIHQLAASR